MAKKKAIKDDALDNVTGGVNLNELSQKTNELAQQNLAMAERTNMLEERTNQLDVKVDMLMQKADALTEQGLAKKNLFSKLIDRLKI